MKWKHGLDKIPWGERANGEIRLVHPCLVSGDIFMSKGRQVIPVPGRREPVRALARLAYSNSSLSDDQELI